MSKTAKVVQHWVGGPLNHIEGRSLCESASHEDGGLALPWCLEAGPWPSVTTAKCRQGTGEVGVTDCSKSAQLLAGSAGYSKGLPAARFVRSHLSVVST